MPNNNDIDILGEYKKLLALNSSFESRLDEYARIIKERDYEIEMLQEMLTEATSHRSNLDSQVDEFKNLQQSIAQLKQQAEGPSFIGSGKHLRPGETANVQQQLEDLKLQYTYLQTQLSELQTQCLELNNRNLLLQQQTSRVSELESLLENAEEEIRQLKLQQGIPQQKPL